MTENEIQPRAARQPIEIENDASTLRYILQEIIETLRGPEKRPSSRAAALAVTKLQEARYWLGEHMMGEE